jgi:hypothetical protein
MLKMRSVSCLNLLFSLRPLRLCGALFIMTAQIASAADAPPPAKKVMFQDDLMPILRDACLNCHNPEKKKAGLDLSTYQAAMTGSDNGAVVKPGDPSASLLIKTITHSEEPFMPQKADKLPDPKIALFKTWIATGAPETANSKVTVVAKKNDLSTAVAKVGKPEGPPPMPAVSLSLEPITYTQRPGALGALAASPWAPLAALGGQHQIVLYQTQTLDVLGILPFDAGQPDVIRFSKNGALLIVGGGQAAKSGKVIAWDVKTGKKVAEVGDEFDAVLAADMSPDQSSVVLGTPNKTLKCYNTSDGKVVWTVKKHTDWVTAAAFSPDGVLVASGDRAGNLYVFEAKTGRDFYTLAGHKDAITDLAFRDDGNVLASASADGMIKLWNMHEGNQIKSQNAHGNGVMSLAFAHDGRIATCGRDAQTKVWNAEGDAPKTMENPLADVALHVAFTDDGTRVIAGDWLGNVRIWTAADGKKVADITANPAGPAARLAGAQKLVADLQSQFDGATKSATDAAASAHKADGEYASARAAKGADVVDAALNKKNQAEQPARQATDALNDAKNNVQQKQNELNRLSQEKIQLGIQMENVQKGQRQGLRQRIQQNEQQLKQAEEQLAAAKKDVPAKEEAAKKTQDSAKEASEALTKAINEADPAAKPLPQKGQALAAANDAANKAKAAVSAAEAKLKAAQADLDRLKQAIAGGPPTTRPAATQPTASAR